MAPSRLRAFLLLSGTILFGCASPPRLAETTSQPAWTLQTARDAALHHPLRPKLGRLHLPLGTRVVVQGEVIEGPRKGWEDGPNLRVKRIDGRGTQERIRLKLASENPAGQKWREGGDDRFIGQSFELEGYEDGYIVGTDPELLKPGPNAVYAQTVPWYFLVGFVATRVRSIAPVVLSAREFVGQDALLQGVARSSDGRAVFDAGGADVVVDAAAPWPPGIEGKLVEVRGMVRTSGADLTVDGHFRLVRLEDQVGMAVELRGYLGSDISRYWLWYRRAKLAIEDVEHRPGFSWRLRTIVVRGTLARAVPPPPTAESRLPWEPYIVRDARFEPIDDLLTPEDPDR
jgi:hypothetical protein